MRKVRWITACLLAVAVTSVSAEEWKKEFMLYGWLAGLEGTVGIGDVGSAPVSATFDDLWGFVDFAMAGHAEIKNAKKPLSGRCLVHWP